MKALESKWWLMSRVCLKNCWVLNYESWNPWTILSKLKTLHARHYYLGNFDGRLNYGLIHIWIKILAVVVLVLNSNSPTVVIVSVIVASLLFWPKFSDIFEFRCISYKLTVTHFEFYWQLRFELCEILERSNLIEQIIYFWCNKIFSHFSHH